MTPRTLPDSPAAIICVPDTTLACVPGRPPGGDGEVCGGLTGAETEDVLADDEAAWAAAVIPLSPPDAAVLPDWKASLLFNGIAAGWRSRTADSSRTSR